MTKETHKKFFLGSAVEITTILSVATATSAKITILDPSASAKVSQVDMTYVQDKVYQYIYQSASTDTQGWYVIQIDVVSGGYTTHWEDKFILELQTIVTH